MKRTSYDPRDGVERAVDDKLEEARVPKPYTGEHRQVTLIHWMGGKKEGLKGLLMKAAKRPNQVFVFWDLDTPQCFNLKTGNVWGCGKKRLSKWRLSDEDLKHFRKEAKS